MQNGGCYIVQPCVCEPAAAASASVFCKLFDHMHDIKNSWDLTSLNIKVFKACLMIAYPTYLYS